MKIAPVSNHSKVNFKGDLVIKGKNETVEALHSLSKSSGFDAKEFVDAQIQLTSALNGAPNDVTLEGHNGRLMAKSDTLIVEADVNALKRFAAILAYKQDS